MKHIAVVHRRYLQALLSGAKTIESRLSRTRRPPYGCVSPGDQIYFKTPGGPVAAVADVADVQCHSDLTPTRIGALKRDLNGQVLADDAYWESKTDARYATFLWLGRVRPIENPSDSHTEAPAMNGRAWICLNDTQQVARASRPCTGGTPVPPRPS